MTRRINLATLPRTPQRDAPAIQALVDDLSIEDELLTSHELQAYFEVDSCTLMKLCAQGLNRLPIVAKNNPRHVLYSMFRLSDLRIYLAARQLHWMAHAAESALILDEMS